MKINGYELSSIEFIGSHGPWWRTRCPDGSQALSCLFSAGEADALMDRWRRWSQLENQHVVTLIDLIEHQDGRCLVVEEWVKGQSLEALLALGQPPAVLAGWYQQVADGLEAFHQANLVHGDITPANVVIAEDGRAVIVDVANDPDTCLGTLGWSEGGQAGMAGDLASLQRLAEALGVPLGQDADRRLKRDPDPGHVDDYVGDQSVEAHVADPQDFISASRADDDAAQSQTCDTPRPQARRPTAAHTWRALAESTPTVMARQAPSWKPRLVALAGALVLAGGVPWGVHMAVGAQGSEEHPCPDAQSVLGQLNGLLAKRDQAIMDQDADAVGAVSLGDVAQDDQMLVSRLKEAGMEMKELNTLASDVSQVACQQGQVVAEAAIQQQSATRCDASGACQSVPAQPEHWLSITLDGETFRVLSVEPLD